MRVVPREDELLGREHDVIDHALGGDLVGGALVHGLPGRGVVLLVDKLEHVRSATSASAAAASASARASASAASAASATSAVTASASSKASCALMSSRSSSNSSSEYKRTDGTIKSSSYDEVHLFPAFKYESNSAARFAC